MTKQQEIEYHTMSPAELCRVNNAKSVLTQLRLLRSQEIPTVALLAYKTKINHDIITKVFKWIEEIGGLKFTGHNMIAGSIRQTWKVNHLICQQMLDCAPDETLSV